MTPFLEISRSGNMVCSNPIVSRAVCCLACYSREAEKFSGSKKSVIIRRYCLHWQLVCGFPSSCSKKNNSMIPLV